MNNWKIKKLRDIAEINPKETLKKGSVCKKISMDKLIPYCRDIDDFELDAFNGGAKFRNGDTIMARITPCLENGKISQINCLNQDEVGFGSTEFIVFRAKEGVDKDFLYYLISSDLVKQPAIKSMVGSSGRQRVQNDVVADLDIKIPELSEQRRIGALLKDLDDKIHINGQINKNLEEQVITLYEKFLSPKVLTKGKRVTLDEYCSIFTGKKNANASVKGGQYKFFTCSPTILHINSYIYDGNAIIISGNGSYTGRTQFYRGKFALYQRTYACTMLKNIDPDLIYLLYWFIKLELVKKINGGTRGSAIPYIVMNDLAKFEFIFEEETFANFLPIIKNITETIQSNVIENNSLTEIRDTILPQLLEGNIDI